VIAPSPKMQQDDAGGSQLAQPLRGAHRDRDAAATTPLARACRPRNRRCASTALAGGNAAGAAETPSIFTLAAP
jgi:hypothetical protein